MDELVGSLIAHEQILAQLTIEEDKNKKEKPIALKAVASDSSDEESTSCEDDEVSLLTRKFHRFLKKNKRKHEPWKNKSRRSGPPKQGEVICFECKKPGHIKVDCPTLKKDHQ